MMEGNVGYAYLEFPTRLCRVNLKELSSGEQPPLEEVANFQNLSLPVGMGAFILDSKLYMTGGEKVLKDIDLEEHLYLDQVLDASDGDKGLNTRVFVFDPLNSVTPFSQCLHFPPLIFPKPNPKVANIDGIIYVLASLSYYFGEDLPPPPTFECFDPQKGLWEMLPKPPWYSSPDKRQYATVLYFEVLFRKIHVGTVMGSFSYDVDSQKWRRPKSFFRRSGFGFRVPLPFSRHHSAANFGDGFVISQSLDGVTAYQFGPKQILTWHRTLDEIGHLINRQLAVTGFVRYLAPRRFCYVNTASDSLLTVSVYQMEMNNGAQDNSVLSLSIKLLYSHTYDLDSLSCDNGLISNVFIMYDDTKKRGTDFLERDKAGKKQILNC